MTAVAASVGSAPPRPRRPGRPAKRAAPERPYINRELSWLDYAARVLFEARDARNPLLDRVNFLTIFASMLDEFFQIRIVRPPPAAPAGSTTTSPDGRTAGEQLVAARKRVLELVAELSVHLGRHPKALAARGHRDRQVRRDPGAPRHAPPAVHRRDLPGPHAARGRSGPPVPVHLDAQPLDRGRAARPRDRRAPLRPGQGPPDPAAALPDRAEPLRAARPDHRGQPRPAVQRAWRSSSTTCSGSPATPTSRSRRTRPTTCCSRSRRSSGGGASARPSGSRSSGRCRRRRGAILLRGLGLGEDDATRSGACST